ncbi:MAG TPA: hypothetical protein VL359_00100 [bacterium]|nr:hypothetical protein [bacterium]
MTTPPAPSRRFAAQQERLHALTRKSDMIANLITGRVAEMQRGVQPWSEPAQDLSIRAMASLEKARDAALDAEHMLAGRGLTPHARELEQALHELRSALGRLKQRLGLLLLQELTAPTSFRAAYGYASPMTYPRMQGRALPPAHQAD